RRETRTCADQRSRHRRHAPRGCRVRPCARGGPRARPEGADAVMRTLITNIGELSTCTDAGIIHDAAVLIEEGRIAWVGASTEADNANVTVVDAASRAMTPGFVDSHSHIVFGGDRAAEFEARMAGEKYAAGGIRSTVAATRAAPEDQLRARLRGFIAE